MNYGSMDVPTTLAISTFVVGFTLATRAAMIDARTHRLPNRLVGPLALVGVGGLVTASIWESDARYLDFVMGSVAYAGPWLALNLISPSSIGFGDVKFAGALGIYLAWFDPKLAFLAVVLTIVLAWPQSLVQALRPDAATLALGPYLLAGAAASIIVFLV
jgi:leader peptidase (prepilin peptidase) / N-methyltransferase